MIEIGGPYTFRPSCMIPSRDSDRIDSAVYEYVPRVTGTVVLINRPHRWFRVRYVTPAGCVYHECFPLPTEAAPELLTEENRKRPYQMRALRPSVWRDGVSEAANAEKRVRTRTKNEKIKIPKGDQASP